MKKNWIIFGLLVLLTVIGLIWSYAFNATSYVGVFDFNWPALKQLTSEQQSQVVMSIKNFNIVTVIPFWALAPLWVGFSAYLLIKLRKKV